MPCEFDCQDCGSNVYVARIGDAGEREAVRAFLQRGEPLPPHAAL